jgi:uncharacterized protein involved in outer membrane biogenesis
MRRRKGWFFLWILIPVLILGVVGYLLFYYLFDPAFYKKILEESLTQALNKEVSIGKAKISFWDGVGFAFDDFHVKDHPLGSDLLHSRRLILLVKLFPLLKGEVKWKRIILDQPSLRLFRDKEGRLNLLGDLLTAGKVKASHRKMIQGLSTLFGGSITLRDGEITFSDEGLGPTPLITEIKAFYFSLSEVSHRTPFPFRLSGDIIHSNKRARIAVSGTIRNIPEDMDLSKGSVDARVELKGIQTLHFWPYFKSLLPMEMISGDLDVAARFQGDFQGSFKASADIRFKDLIFDCPKVFAYVMRPDWMNVNLTIVYDREDLRVPLLSVELPELWVKAKGKIYGIGSKQMGIDAEAESGSFDLSEGKKFIPFRIITRDVSEPLFRSEGNGPVQILSVKLSGKMLEVEHCDQPPYAHILSVDLKVNGIRLRLPWDLPSLENLKGRLSYRDGDLNFEETEGKVFHSSIDRADGTFYQLLQIPTLQTHLEGRIDLRDLPSFTNIEGLDGDLSEIFSPLQIDSGHADYRLSTKVVLKSPLHFQHQGSYHLWKARFTHRQVPFPILIGDGKIDLSNAGAQWSGMKVELGDSSFLINGSWKREARGTSIELTAKGKADLKNLLSLAKTPFFPEEARSKTEWIEELSGTTEFFFKGEGQSGLKFSSYEGEVSPRGVRLRPKGIPSLLIFKEGTLSFSPLGVDFSKLKISSNLSSLTLDGNIKDGTINLSTRGLIDLKDLFPLLQSPFSPDPIRTSLKEIQQVSGITEGHLKWTGKREEGMALLKEGEIRLSKVSLKHEEMVAPLSSVEGSLLLSPEQIRFVGLKGMIGNSPISFSGTLSRRMGTEEGDKAKGNFFAFQLNSPSLDLDSLFPKRQAVSPLSFGKLRDWLSSWSLDGKIEIEQGRYWGLSFQGLRVEMKTIGEKLVLGPFQFKGLGGDFWGGGWIAPIDKGIRFEITPRVSNMEAKAFLRTLLQKGEEEKMEITGRVHIDRVELRGEGEDFQRVRQSLNGNLRLEVENGMIERWKTLGRIFSILNVSQWFWGRLPDLKTKGLPYRQIMANIQVKDGIASTEDFIVQSDAIRITLLGKIDFVKSQIDATVGVHPLVTIDMILSHLPVAGYILTGQDKAFLSYVYEVKGDLGDPEIEAVPMKGLRENFWGIIQRLLETPIRPFQKAPNNGEKK